MAGNPLRTSILAGFAFAGASRGAFGQHTERNSVDSSGAQANGASTGVSLSADGRFVVFASDATNLVANDRNLSSDMFVHDRVTGGTSLVSADANGIQGNDASFSFSLDAISDDGRFVGFTSDATNLVAGTIGLDDRAYVKDLQTGAIDLVSVDSAGNEANLTSDLDAISADGRFAVFDSLASTWSRATRTSPSTCSSTTGRPGRRTA
jgi:Tol biopolymer transport system component